MALLAKARGKTLKPSDLSKGFCVSSYDWVIGVDEVGAGCLAGPVVAAAYAYPLVDSHLECRPPVRVIDSKILNDKAKDESTEWLRAWSGAFFEIQEISPAEIDRINILRARFKAMSLGIASLLTKIPADARVGIFVDGSILPPEITKHCTSRVTAVAVTKGDGKVFAIAAASIIAKTYRDTLMAKLAVEFPDFGWESNVGYPTPDHKQAIEKLGLTHLHRRSFCSFALEPTLFSSVDS